MTQTYAPAVKAALAQLAANISARAAADSIALGECVVGDKVKDRTFAKSGIYILKPVGEDPEFLIKRRRRAPLRVPAVCVLRSMVDASAVDALTDLEGLVIDAVGADPTLGGKCVLALALDPEPSSFTDSAANLTLHTSTVWVRVIIEHDMG